MIRNKFSNVTIKLLIENVLIVILFYNTFVGKNLKGENDERNCYWKGKI